MLYKTRGFMNEELPGTGSITLLNKEQMVDAIEFFFF
jgi:hypothetical protein